MTLEQHAKATAEKGGCVSECPHEPGTAEHGAWVRAFEKHGGEAQS